MSSGLNCHAEPDKGTTCVCRKNWSLQQGSRCLRADCPTINSLIRTPEKIIRAHGQLPWCVNMIPATRTLLPQENFFTYVASRNQTTGPLQAQESKLDWQKRRRS